MAAQQRQGDIMVVGVAVVECQNCRPCRQVALSQPLDSFVKRKDMKPGFEPTKQRIKPFGVHLVWHEGIRPWDDAMKDQDAQASSCTRRRQQMEQTLQGTLTGLLFAKRFLSQGGRFTSGSFGSMSHRFPSSQRRPRMTSTITL